MDNTNLNTNENQNSSEYNSTYNFMQHFFEVYYKERNPQKIVDMTADEILAIGLGAGEVAHNKNDFFEFVNQQMTEVSFALPYTISDYSQIQCGEHLWNCFAQVNITIRNGDWGKVIYNIRVSTVVRTENDASKLYVIHVSESMLNQDSIRYTLQGTKDNDTELERIINQLVPGGIISCYTTEDYPISIANEQFLRMTGFTSLNDFKEANGGLFINCIHPSDRNKYIYNVKFAIASGKQCESEYRIKRKNNSYVWVHDIAQRAISGNGSQVVVSAIIDISDQVNKRYKLEQETEIDDLTGIYNRKGAKRQIELNIKHDTKWLFCMADLDNFKRVNDIYGHSRGDQVLKYISDELRNTFASIGFVFRFGGDEFAFLIYKYNDKSDVAYLIKEVAVRYKSLLKEICPEANSSISVGGVFGEGLKRFQTMCEKADKNLYDIKKTEKGYIKLTNIDEVE